MCASGGAEFTERSRVFTKVTHEEGYGPHAPGEPLCCSNYTITNLEKSLPSLSGHQQIPMEVDDQEMGEYATLVGEGLIEECTGERQKT
jgi:hypothetical protein